MDPKEFKQQRQAMNLTQEELAALLDVKSNTVSRYETGLLKIPKVVELAMLQIEANTPKQAK